MLKAAYELFPDDDERDEFLEALTAGDAKDQAMIVIDERPELKAFPRVRRLDWQPKFVERIDDTFKPSKHPLYAKGAYYTLDFSSIFSASSILAMDKAPQRVLDLCASPGGKAIFTWKAYHPELLLCNEVMRNRAGYLIGNLHRCKCDNAAVWSADPSIYARKYKAFFDLVICDAPCSGQSLIAKGVDTEGCWDANMIDTNVGRQRRITGHAYHCVRPGGYLMYATCTYSKKENEKVMEWLLGTYDDLEVVEVPHLKEYQSKYSERHCYRLFPQDGLGAGAFVVLLRRQGSSEPHAPLGEIASIWKSGDDFTPPEQTNAKEEEVYREPKKRPRPHPSTLGRNRPPTRKRPEYKGRSSGKRRGK